MNFPLPERISDTATTHDAILGGRLRLAQPAKGHRAGTDAVLLAATTPPARGLVIDAGAGVGTVGLALAMRDHEARVYLIERETVFAMHARDNIIANGLDGRVSVVETNLLAAFPRRNAGVKNESADLVVTNPPFFEAGSSRASPDQLKRDAHVIDGSLDEWLRACLTLLKPGGLLSLVHRADALGAIMATLAGRTGGVTVRPVHARSENPASRVLIQAIKGSRAPLALLPALILHRANGSFTTEAAALHDGLWLERSLEDQLQMRT